MSHTPDDPDAGASGYDAALLRRLLGYLRPYRWLTAAAVLLLMTQSVLALIGLVRNLAMEFGPQGIRFNAICPGLVKTDFARALWDNPEVEKRHTLSIPLRRLGEPEDFAGIAVFLGSDASKYMTGQALTVCGGSSMWS